MSSLIIQSPGGGPDVTRRNRRSLLYITTDPTAVEGTDDLVDGSIRFHFEPGETIAHLEVKSNGVWNDTGLRVSSSSLGVGRDLLMGAVASFIETQNPSLVDEHTKALIPHIPFDDTGTFLVHTPVLDKLENVPIFSGAVSEQTGTTLGQIYSNTTSRVVETITHEIGTVSTTTQASYKIYVGNNNTGFLISSQNIDSSRLSAGSTLVVVFDFDIGFRANQNYFFELSSTSNLSLETDVSGNWLTEFSEQELKPLGMITENLMLDEDLNLMFDTELNPMYAIQFP